MQGCKLKKKNKLSQAIEINFCQVTARFAEFLEYLIC